MALGCACDRVRSATPCPTGPLQTSSVEPWGLSLLLEWVEHPGSCRAGVVDGIWAAAVVGTSQPLTQSHLCPRSRPTVKDCFANTWLQDAYLMKLRRQTLTFTTNRLKEFLVEHQRRRSEAVTKHKVLLRSYQGGQPPGPQ